MSLPYGRFPKKKTWRRSAVHPAARIHAKLGDHADLEGLSFALQTVIARLQEMDVSAVGKCSLYFTPLDPSGSRVVLYCDEGRPLELIDIERFLNDRAHR